MERRCFFADDGGFTSMAVVVATLLALALLFTSVRVYGISSTSGDIQFVADAAALAAENVVSEYLIVARVADATVLSMGLLSLMLFAISAIVSCIPAVGSFGPSIVGMAKDVAQARTTFSRDATKGLDRLEQALPFLCVASSIATIEANSVASGGAVDYRGLAVPFPLTGSATEFSGGDVPDSTGEVISKNDKTAYEAVEETKDATEKLDEALIRGYEADCGKSGMCLWERTRTLANLSTSKNPFYSSIEGWSFSVPLERAREYYRARTVAEPSVLSSTSDVEEEARSIARSKFYLLAQEILAKGHAKRSKSGTTKAYLPLLPSNTDEMRRTHLYTDSDYPLSRNGSGELVLHMSSRCPAYAEGAPAGNGALKGVEDGRFLRCPTCRFSISTIGRVPAASTAIDNGFEYYYRIIAKAAADYSDASKELEDASQEARAATSESADEFACALSSLASERYDPSPPGRDGCVAIVIDPSSHAVSTFGKSLVASRSRLAPRIAISAAALTSDDPERGNNLISSFFDALVDDVSGASVSGGSMLASVADGAISLWGDLLYVYLDGSECLGNALTLLIDSIPGIGGTELSGWAENSIKDVLELSGFEPAAIDIPKPITVNTAHVLSKGDGSARALTKIRKTYTSIPGDGNFSSVSDVLLPEIETLRAFADSKLEGEYTVATIGFDEAYPGLPSIPITVRLPETLVGRGGDLLDETESSIRSLTNRLTGTAGEVGAGIWR